jgi:hypothetical protein
VALTASAREERSNDVAASSWYLRQYSRAALITAGTIYLLHFGLLAASIFDYRVTIDSAYDVAMARQWGEHLLVPWDHVNFGPQGRPNLQGPVFQAAIGWLGRMFGGNGDDYVLANSIAALVQWSAAIASAAFFAFQLDGAWALLFAVSLLTGAACASASFAIGIPSGWLFILVGWSIWCFVRGRPILASIAGSLAIYMHVAGFAVVPVAILIAALLTKRWRDLLVVGVLVAILTSPYAFHVIRYLNYFSGAQSYPALLFDPLLDLLTIVGMVTILMQPRRNPFLAAWLVAPMVWLLHDPARLILQAALAGSVVAGLILAQAMRRIARFRLAALVACVVPAVATIFPLGVPALAPELSWDMGFRYPRGVDWQTAAALADKINQAGLSNQLIADYQPALCPALAVFAPITCEKGHWVEVQPRHDAADDLPAFDKVYILPLPAGDPLLTSMEVRGWITSHASVSANTIVTLSRHIPLKSIAVLVPALVSDNSAELSAIAINNTISLGNWRSVVSVSAAQRRQTELEAQRVLAGRIELACLLYADAQETLNSEKARSLRRCARGFGVLASFLSDGFTIDYISDARLTAFRRELRDFEIESAQYSSVDRDQGLISRLNEITAAALDIHDDTFAERPKGNLFPWIDGDNLLK